jgi:hypothetical protein
MRTRPLSQRDSGAYDVVACAPLRTGALNQLRDRKNAWRGRRTVAYSSRIAGKLFQLFSKGVFRNEARQGASKVR